jgi:hypothetical protein
MAYSKPQLRERLKKEVMAGTKGGKAGQWSARKAQILAQRYEAAGGGYKGGKTAKQKSLSKWTKEDWGTKSGKPSTQGSQATGERYLPKKARAKLSATEYKATSDKKRRGTKAGKQFVANTPKAKKASKAARKAR